MRRHVVKTTIAYVAASWIMIEAADLLQPAFGAPDWTVRAVFTVLVILLPLVAVLSWVYDISPGGVHKTKDDYDTGLSRKPWFRRGLVALTGAFSVAGIWWVWASDYLDEKRFATEDDDVFPKIVVVGDFRPLVGDEEREWLGAGIANLVRGNLSLSKDLQVVSQRRWQAIMADQDDSEAAAAVAGIRYLVEGEVIGSRSGMMISARLIDTKTGEQLVGKDLDAADEGLALEKATALSHAIRAGLKVPELDRVDFYAADYAAEHPSAYRAFISALEYWVNYDFTNTERLLRSALELQPNFAMARYYLAWVLAVQDRVVEAQEQLDLAFAVESLTPREQMYIEALAPSVERDMDLAIQAYEQLLEEYPYDTEARSFYAEALYHLGRYDEAAAQYRLLTELEPEVQLGWSYLAYILIEMGDFDAARPAIERFTDLAPDNPNAFVLRGDLNRAEGNLAEAARDYQAAIQKGPDLQEAIVSLGAVQYLQGETDRAVTTLEGLIHDDNAVPRYRIDAAFAAGGIADGLGQFRRHIAYLDLLNPQLKAAEIEYSKALAEKAIAKLELGEPKSEIEELIRQSIEASPGVPTRYLFARGLFELAIGKSDAVADTAEEIRSYALPPDDPDQTEAKAANYLLGRVAIANNDYALAIKLLQSAVEVSGYNYCLYEGGLAEALSASGQVSEAIVLLEDVLEVQDTSDPRLDLELDRARAKLHLASLYSKNDQPQKADEAYIELGMQWSQADPEFDGAGLLNQIASR